jgi:hypothetical protein
VVRRALQDFDFAAFKTPRREQCQISVRLPPARKRTLFQCARQKKVSAGELLRTALEAFSPRSRRLQLDRVAAGKMGRKVVRKKAAGRKRG